ncbi:ferredoxin [Streptomyces radicis]|uniref:ferredoxin n=1 Tax=Streptomyces radicis TaxID=1750517 RepID=UPI002E33E512|nr:ferredoxin [Streptomyces radicis]
MRADTALCVSTGSCALTAPEVFDLGEDDGVVVVLVESPPDEQRETVGRAVRACPAGVLSLAP